MRAALAGSSEKDGDDHHRRTAAHAAAEKAARDQVFGGVDTHADTHTVAVIDTAGRLLVTAGDNPQRLRSEPAFAALCGVSPIPASSGRTHRHRLNRGGDRQANAALYRVVLCRMRWDPRTQSSVQRRTTEGLSKKDVIRCLKRLIARELHYLMASPDNA